MISPGLERWNRSERMSSRFRRVKAQIIATLQLGRDSGLIGSRVEEAEARINRKYRNSLRSLKKARENCVILE